MKEYFDPYLFDYKSYSMEKYGLKEMPNRLPAMSDTEADYIDNSYDAMSVERNGKLIGHLKHNNESLRVYREEEDGKVWISLLSEDKPIIAAEHVYKRITYPIRGIVNLGIKRFKWYRHVIWKWFENEIIPKEPVIISDSTQTEKGYNFWRGLFREYVIGKESHEMFVLNFDNGKYVKNISDENEMEEFFQHQGFGKFRFVLKRKNYDKQ